MDPEQVKRLRFACGCVLVLSGLFLIYVFASLDPMPFTVVGGLMAVAGLALAVVARRE
ncbi:hypothetical protein ACFQ80_16480 [Isoptericola sp. NPDC056578]|uniref:hypothetical protein n=1 Tax=Isoptericola sp. NPDC056578 TaxID=3345870 RepID=UPI0036862CE8